MALTTQQRSALGVVRAVLRDYGLESLASWAMESIINGLSESEIIQALRERPEYEARFPGIKLREERGLPPISPADYVNYERAASSLGAYYDIPFNLANRALIGELFANDVSAAELETRIRDGYGRVDSLPQEVQDWFADQYGPSSRRALAAFFVDPDRAAPELLKMAQAAEAGGRAARLGIGVDRLMAEGLVESGVSGAQSQGGFEELARERALYDETITEADDLDISRQGVEATFGLSGTSRELVERRRDQRAARFAGSGEAFADRGGITGLGVADQ